jgi:hypothetical protein
MGRHSAPDDDEALPSEHAGSAIDVAEPAVGTESAVGTGVAAAVEAGRHHTPDEQPPTAPVAAASEPAPSEQPPTAPVAAPSPAAPSQPKPDTGTHADLRLLRENPSLRARCAAGVVVPFLLYTVVLVIIARVDLYLLWVWIPTVTAGVLVGTFLDVEHHRRKRR